MDNYFIGRMKFKIAKIKDGNLVVIGDIPHGDHVIRTKLVLTGDDIKITNIQETLGRKLMSSETTINLRMVKGTMKIRKKKNGKR